MNSNRILPIPKLHSVSFLTYLLNSSRTLTYIMMLFLYLVFTLALCMNICVVVKTFYYWIVAFEINQTERVF